MLGQICMLMGNSREQLTGMTLMLAPRATAGLRGGGQGVRPLPFLLLIRVALCVLVSNHRGDIEEKLNVDARGLAVQQLRLVVRNDLALSCDTSQLEFWCLASERVTGNPAELFGSTNFALTVADASTAFSEHCDLSDLLRVSTRYRYRRLPAHRGQAGACRLKVERNYAGPALAGRLSPSRRSRTPVCAIVQWRSQNRKNRPRAADLQSHHRAIGSMLAPIWI
jgi:hypothetical protein